MGAFDDLVESVTYRLRPDPELQMEVAQEIRAHLDDSAETARAEGASESAAEEQAVRDFGDPKLISEKLWEANFRRIRLRAAAKWVGRLILIPAAILLGLLLCWEAMGFATLLSLTGKSPAIAHFFHSSERRTSLPYRKDLSADDAVVRDILEQKNQSRYQDAQRLVARFPENRLFRAHMALLYLNEKIESAPKPLPPETLEEAWGVLGECEAIEPENALYNYLKAEILFMAGASDPSFTYSTVNADGDTNTTHGYQFKILDENLFQKGLGEYQKGIAKPYCDAYAVPFLEYYLSLREKPDALLEEMGQIAISAGMLLPHLSMMRALTRKVMAYANQLINNGEYEAAVQLLRDAPIPGTQLGDRAHTLITLLVGRSMRQTALSQGAALYEKMGMGHMADEARDIAIHESKRYGTTQGPPEEQTTAWIERVSKRGGILSPFLLSAGSVPDEMTIALRNAERTSLERAALGLMALLLLSLIGWCGMRTVVSMWQHRKDTSGPKILFVGWKRFIGILFLSVIVPIGVYALFTRLPFGSAQYGINYILGRITLEIATTIFAVLGLSIFLGIRAIRTHACQLGMVAPNRRCNSPLVKVAWILGGLWTLAAALYFWRWENTGAVGVALSVSLIFIALIMLASLAIQRPKQEEQEYLRSECRSLIPILTACLIVLGILARTSLSASERSAINIFHQPGMRLYIDELKYSPWSDYQEYLKTLPDHGAM